MLFQNKEKKEVLKISVTTWWEPFLYIAVLLLSFFYLAKTNISDPFLVIYTTLILSGLMIIIEVFKHTKKIVQENSENRKLNPNILEVVRNTLISYVGVILGIILILFTYWFLPDNEVVQFKASVEEVKFFILCLTLLLSPIMIFLSEYFLGSKKNGTFQMGLLATLQFKKINLKTLRDGILEWIIRLFFLTLNFVGSVMYVDLYRETMTSFSFLSGLNFVQIVLLFEAVIFMIIMMIIIPGYLFSWRLIGTDAKKIDSTWFAWTFLLICYPPFMGKIFSDVFNYSGPNDWTNLFGNFDFLLWICGFLILFFAFIHLWAEAQLGVRSSNLTNRGIITNGSFRYTKHPVYLSKLLSWFFLSLPFFNGATLPHSIQLGIAFLFICSIYGCRCLSEERLLATDKNYIKYALWMDKNATFSFVNKIFPFMSFEWRYAYWTKKNMLQN